MYCASDGHPDEQADATCYDWLSALSDNDLSCWALSTGISADTWESLVGLLKDACQPSRTCYDSLADVWSTYPLNCPKDCTEPSQPHCTQPMLLSQGLASNILQEWRMA